MGKNYAPELQPRDNKGTPLPVYVNVSVLAIPAIDTVNLKYTADFFLSLRWYDLRLDLRDLNDVSTLNSLGPRDLESIWNPSLAFVNALGPFQTEIDSLVDGELIREAEPLDEDFSTAIEGIKSDAFCGCPSSNSLILAMIFSGEKNSIRIKREYFLDYSCIFDLTYFPFDSQVSSISLS